MLVSVDVFDTCLSRRYLHPTDLFIVLARRILRQDHRKPAGEETVFELARLRQAVEQRVRQASPNEDIDLHTIYAGFSELATWGIDPRDMLAEELSVERDAVCGVDPTRHIVNNHRRRGDRVIFVSDMYLPQEFVGELLISHRFAGVDTTVYTSGSIGLTKHSGRLFEYVLEREGVSPDQVVHYGDNPHSDGRIPASLGIRTVPVNDAWPTCFERARDLPAPVCDPLANSMLAGVGRAARLRAPVRSFSERVFEDVVCGGIAPLLASFTLWVIRDAVARRIERLYFVSRDGQVLADIAAKLAKHVPAPEIRYLYGSRQAWFLPAVDEPDAFRDWIMPKAHSSTPRDILARLGLRPDELTESLAQVGLGAGDFERPLRGEKLQRLLAALRGAEIMGRVLEAARSTRESTVAYFHQEGLGSPGRWALVDIGWTLKTQRAVRKLLQDAGMAEEVEGYYLAVRRNHAPSCVAGQFRAYCLEGRDDLYGRLPLSALFANINFLEQIVTKADHGMTMHYAREGGRVVPVLKAPPSSGELHFVRRIRTGLGHYAEELGRATTLHGQTWLLKSHALMSFSLAVSDPPRAFVHQVEHLRVGDDQNESRLVPLVRRLTLIDWFGYLRFIIERATHPSAHRPFEWQSGSLQLSSLLMRYLFKATLDLERRLEPFAARLLRYLRRRR